jgi:hypothetical protein
MIFPPDQSTEATPGLEFHYEAPGGRQQSTAISHLTNAWEATPTPIKPKIGVAAASHS